MATVRDRTVPITPASTATPRRWIARTTHGRGVAGRGWTWLVRSWPVRGFREAEAGNLAAIIAFNALVALVPTVLLLISVAGLLVRRDDALLLAARLSFWGLPASDARDAFGALVDARRNGERLGVISLIGFLWVGGGFVNSLSYCLNRVYGLGDCEYTSSRRRGFIVVVLFAVLFSAAALAATLPTLFIARDLDGYFESWFPAAARGQILGYLIAFATATLLFLVLYRIVPTAGQRFRDVYPGALLGGAFFVLLWQAFPLYLRVAGGANRFGAAFGLVTLLVTWFSALAHVLLFGCYVNATYRRRLRRLHAAKLRAAASSD